MTPEQEFLESQKEHREFYNISADDEAELLKHFPDKKYFEFLYHAWHNGLNSDHWGEWSPWEIWNYPIRDLIRYKNILLNNSELIKGAKVANIGSHIGVEILFSLNMGAKYCVGIEPIEKKNELATFVCQKAGFKNFELVTGELKQEHIYQNIKDFDTLILSGFMDMIPDHYRLIDSVSTTGIENIIIEVGEKEEHSRSIIPHITWNQYGTDEHGYGPFNPSVTTAMHGFPNLAFLKILLGEFGYEFQKQDFFHHTSQDTEKPKLRSVSVFKKSKKR
jgi:hypothetical protein